jgi:sulfhydrogenase subunit beta (sulfur reductase)
MAQVGDRLLVEIPGFSALLAALRADGYRLVGPAVRDGAVVHAEIEGVEDLPAGWTEVQEAGTYRLRRRGDAALFGYAVGPHSWKQLFFVPTVRLWRARRRGESFTVQAEEGPLPRLALIGARSCDLAGLAIQDRILLADRFVDQDYASRRRAAFVLAVQCGAPGGTCFCASMGTGPRARAGFDLALTELLEGRHRFVAEVGSETGAAFLGRVEHAQAQDGDVRAAEAVSEAAAGRMGRNLQAAGVRDLLFRNLEHPRWDEVATRCFACTNCTLVCPTCFCATVEDTTDLPGDEAERVRRWDSCYTPGHSELHGGPVHRSIRSRYRQWLTHKLASWIDQFGMSGCVGCGRCITWCPVGIDLTEEVAAIRAGESTAEEAP